MKRGVLCISHGSRSPKTKLEIEEILLFLKAQSLIPVFEFAFLEIESPSILEGIENCVNKGAEEIIILLNFLNSGQHVDIDIPKILDEAKIKYPSIEFHLTKPLGQYPGIIDLFLNILNHYEKK